jgi:hypothetical protein
MKEYQPGPELHRIFADLEPTGNAVLEFANRYGPLRERLDHCAMTLWAQQIAQMRRMVALKTALDKSDWPAIRENLEPFYAHDLPAAREIAAKIKAGKRLPEPDLANAAGLMLACFADKATIRPTWDSAGQRVTLAVQPSDLLEALWLQFARSVLDQQQYRRCEVCGRWYPGTEDPDKKRKRSTIRSDRRVCSDSCRVKAYARRKRRTLELHAKGWTARRIAKEVGSESDTVRGWIASSKESSNE